MHCLFSKIYCCIFRKLAPQSTFKIDHSYLSFFDFAQEGVFLWWFQVIVILLRLLNSSHKWIALVIWKNEYSRLMNAFKIWFSLNLIVEFASDYAERRSLSGIRRFLYPILLIRFFPRMRSFFWRSCQLMNVVVAATQQTINPSVNAGPYILLKVRRICMDSATDPDKRMNQLKNVVSIFFNLVN